MHVCLINKKTLKLWIYKELRAGQWLLRTRAICSLSDNGGHSDSGGFIHKVHTHSRAFEGLRVKVMESVLHGYFGHWTSHSQIDDLKYLENYY